MREEDLKACLCFVFTFTLIVLFLSNKEGIGKKGIDITDSIIRALNYMRKDERWKESVQYVSYKTSDRAERVKKGGLKV